MRITALTNTSLMFNRFKRNYLKWLDVLKTNSRKLYQKITHQIDRQPLLSFGAILLILLIFIFVSNFIRTPKVEKITTKQSKNVQAFKIGTVPKINILAQIEKTGVIQIVALAGGVIQNINVGEGDEVYQGQGLISLSSNYSGGNALSLAGQLAQKQNQNLEESYPLQKDLITKQRDLANQSLDNFETLRDIASKSVDDTQNTINLNNEIISSLDDSLANLEASPSANSALILSTKQMKTQFLSANLQLNSAIRNTQNQINSDNPPSQLANLQKDITLKQLDIQDKALDLSKEISKLQLQLAYINESLMYPSSPFSGKVERIFVRTGQYVNPGTPLAIISSSNNNFLTAHAYVTQDIISKISKLEPSTILINQKSYDIMPAYISTEATQGNLYSILYNLPKDIQNVTDKSYISVNIPLGYPDTSASIPFVPIDCVYQTQDNATIFVIDNNKAKTKTVTLGNVYGGYVEITQGLNSGDMVILNRNVIVDDVVTSIN